jgi:tetratricopeptide (TPR) repeat protein
MRSLIKIDILSRIGGGDWKQLTWLPAKLLILLLILLASSQKSKAQQTLTYTDEIRFYNRALELFDKEKFATAQKHFNWYQQISKDPFNKINAQYYSAVCAMELFNTDAENLLLKVANQHPQHPKAKLAIFQLGKLHYRNKNNKQAVKYLEQTQIAYLKGPDSKEYYFIYGYSLFKLDRFEDAKNAFAKIKDEKTKYYDATNYYYGYVCYRSGAFDEALEHFSRIKYHKTFGPLAAVYVAQVYFSRGQYEEVIAFADTIKNNEVANDVAGIIGQSHYLLGQYKEAVPHLEQFMQAAPVVPSNTDYYMLGYAYAQTGEHDKALNQFLKMEEKQDSLQPYVFYQMGNSFLKLNKKPQALSSFEKCYQADSTGNLASISLFTAAKIADELNLQGLAMQKYVKYIDIFSEKDQNLEATAALTTEARSNLANLLLTAKNYREALRILEGIKKPNTQDLTNIQRVSYYRAEEHYLNNNFTEANELFTKAASVNYDKKINGLANFWLAEMDYKNQLYQESINHLKNFQNYPEVHSTRFYPISFYNLGYAHLKLSEYEKAVNSFTLYVEKDKDASNPEVYTDAVVRTADCYFADRKYQKAIQYYQLMLDKKMNGGDYALYQQAMILGVLNNNQEKIAKLSQLEKTYPKSPYIDDAVYELADIHLKSEAYEKAIVSFDNIIKNYPRSIYLRKSMLNKSLALFNLKKDEEALEVIKKLITDYPNSDEARAALPLVQNIFVNQGKGEEYLDFIKVLPNVVVSASTQDSLSYESAFNNYQRANYDKAIKGFGSYINKFPGGYFILKANYFKAESDYQLKKYDDALVGYEYVANSLRSVFSERSTRQAAVLNYVKKNYEKALEFYLALERIASNKDNLQIALIGQMRSCSIRGLIDSAAYASQKYLGSPIAQKDGVIEAQTNLGRYYIKYNQFDSAQTAFNAVLKETKTIYGAEAKYNIAFIQYQKKDYKNAQKTIFELNDKFGAFEQWVVKGFILLADTYTAQKDYFQAKATLQSIIENTDDPEVLKTCKAKINEIVELEKVQKSDSRKQIEQRINSREK